jgi:thymidine kinase
MRLVGYLGSMNSMKSAMALMRAYKYRMDGESVIAFKPSRDTRDGEYIVSRALNQKLKANLIYPDERGSMFRMCSIIEPDHVIVDEVQFMPEHQIEELADIAYDLGIKVECYGLKVDFRSRLFEGSKRLIELAEEIITIDNECSMPGCRNQANQNMRHENGVPVFDGEIIKVGKEESYIAVCTACYLKTKKEQMEKEDGNDDQV